MLMVAIFRNIARQFAFLKVDIKMLIVCNYINAKLAAS